MSHTPTPWFWNEGQPFITVVWDGKIVPIAQVLVPKWHADEISGSREAGHTAAFIVKACNAHEDLVKALKAQVNVSESLMRRLGFTEQDILDCTSQARREIAKAEGRTP